MDDEAGAARGAAADTVEGLVPVEEEEEEEEEVVSSEWCVSCVFVRGKKKKNLVVC